MMSKIYDSTPFQCMSFVPVVGSLFSFYAEYQIESDFRKEQSERKPSTIKITRLIERINVFHLSDVVRVIPEISFWLSRAIQRPLYATSYKIFAVLRLVCGLIHIYAIFHNKKELENMERSQVYVDKSWHIL